MIAARRAGSRISSAAPWDKAHDEDAWLCVDDLGRHARKMGRLARGLFVEAHDMVDRDIVADADHETLAAILDHEIDVGDAARQARGLDRALPDRQFADTFAGEALRIEGGH
jgi:hypothetical protein